jgi:hypothetical protein
MSSLPRRVPESRSNTATYVLEACGRGKIRVYAVCVCVCVCVCLCVCVLQLQLQLQVKTRCHTNACVPHRETAPHPAGADHARARTHAHTHTHHSEQRLVRMERNRRHSGGAKQVRRRHLRAPSTGTRRALRVLGVCVFRMGLAWGAAWGYKRQLGKSSTLSQACVTLGQQALCCGVARACHSEREGPSQVLGLSPAPRSSRRSARTAPGAAAPGASRTPLGNCWP